MPAPGARWGAEGPRSARVGAGGIDLPVLVGWGVD
jgi:hypothetical protein